MHTHSLSLSLPLALTHLPQSGSETQGRVVVDHANGGVLIVESTASLGE